MITATGQVAAGDCPAFLWRHLTLESDVPPDMAHYYLIAEVIPTIGRHAGHIVFFLPTNVYP